MYRKPLVRYVLSLFKQASQTFFLKKQFSNHHIAGLYSGIFIMYLQYQASKKETENPIIFYALCVLYILCVAMISADIAAYVTHDVSSNAHIHLYNFDSVQNNIGNSISLVQAILFGCDDFIVQCILVRTTAAEGAYHQIYFQRYTVAGLCGAAIPRS